MSENTIETPSVDTEHKFNIYLLNFQVIYTSGKPVFNSKGETTQNNLGRKRFKRGSKETVSRLYSTIVALNEDYISPETVNGEITKIIANIESSNFDKKADKSQYAGFDNEIILALPINVCFMGKMTTEEANSPQLVYNDSHKYASSEADRTAIAAAAKEEAPIKETNVEQPA